MRNGQARPVGLALASLLVLGLLSLLGPSGAAADTATPAPATQQAAASFRIYATREGLVGGTTANGHVIQPNDHFVALPCACVLSSKGGHEFQVQVSYKGKTITAPVWDIGPWNINDNYWDPPAKRTWPGLAQGVPEATAANLTNYNNGLDGKGRKVQIPSGIDLADGTFADLGLGDSDWVTVTFPWVLNPALPPLPPLPDGYGDIPTVPFGQRPPLDPAAPKTGAGYSFITETRHNVPQPVLDYWYANGSWRNIGLPISELFRVVYADGSWRIVQYFERQILELNLPRQDGLPLVTSGLIGYSAFAPPDSRAPAQPFAGDGGHVYFPPTQHSLSNGFKAHWEQYGGLAAFGYPITEEFGATAPDGRKYVAQVFERARFEWWPDRVGQPDEVTHGLLVVELMRQAGWMP